MRMTLDCVIPTQTGVILTIQCNAYFIDISQGSVETHLQCGGIANCLQSVLVRVLKIGNQ